MFIVIRTTFYNIYAFDTKQINNIYLKGKSRFASQCSEHKYMTIIQ